MFRITRIVVSASLAVLLISPRVLPADNTAAAAKPNVLLIVGDDMGYEDVGFHGSQDIPTPHLDALAASGVRFTNGYVSGPYCSPTRAGLMTGRYQQRFGHEFNPGGRQGLPLRERTLADRLKAAGYVTGLVGKWHLGSQPAMHPQQRGFDEFYGFLGGATTTSSPPVSCAVTSRSTTSITPPMRSDAKPQTSSSGIATGRGSSTSPSTPSTHPCRPPTSGSADSAGSSTSAAAPTAR